MNRHEFLKQLEHALEAEMNPAKVRGHVDYYRSYIAEEVKNGKSEKEVMDLLGDPWVIARSIIDSPLNETEDQYTYADYEEAEQEAPFGTPEIKIKKITGWKIAAVCVGIVLILVLVISLLTGVISMLAPVLVPLLVIWIVLRIVENHRR
ncbi:DUF1700 domain-containing protein [Faecalimonas umbilicata]|uniref:DUF1700 domain-containing protein n=1 Tax=Faecalimonas umbilicata TaxID=1912855 RepID=UPI0022E47099|nr:DUF1700 domain-containing protein [Faecalimonas umbilicata]